MKRPTLWWASWSFVGCLAVLVVLVRVVPALVTP